MSKGGVVIKQGMPSDAPGLSLKTGGTAYVFITRIGKGRRVYALTNRSSMMKSDGVSN